MEEYVRARRLYTYDEMDRLISVTYEDGQKLVYAYDAAGNQISITAVELEPVVDQAQKVEEPTQVLPQPSALPATGVPEVEPQTCAKCQAPLSPGVKFCKQCGAAVVEKEVAPVSEAATATVNCPNCQAPISAGSKFCAQCGKLVAQEQVPSSPATCPQCGRPLKPGAKFCAGCGNAL
ncbi:zinc ribbon domain-containing protein [Chloroflexota bacterium]